MGIPNGFPNRFHNHTEKIILHSCKDSIFMFTLFLILLSSQLVSGKSNNVGVVVTQSDFQALKAIKHDLLDHRGILKSWNVSSSAGACSGWVGIKCVNGNVIAIQLPWKGLAGKISEKIGQLRSLRRISLHNNALTGPIPASLGFLPNLRGVYLFNNQLSGSIPPSLGQCHILQSLDLSNNQLIGTIPLSLANSTRLYRLNLSYNSISGQIPATLSLSDFLTFLGLQHNNLSGSIPASLSLLRNLEEINLSHNLIIGAIPNELGNLSSLKSLDLSNNVINGSFPTSFSNLHSLVSLSLKSNRLAGPIPASISNISSLSLLDLSQNNFTGEITSLIANLQNLSSFDVSYNNLSGSVPSLLLERFNSSSFVGNIQLCGYSVSTPCPAPFPGPQIVLPSPSSGNSRIRHSRKLSTKDIILIGSGAFLIVLLLLLCCLLLCCLIRRKTKSKSKNGKSSTFSMPVPSGDTEYESGGGHTGGKLVHFDGPFVFTADDLLCATAEIMGKSSYGTAYKATLEDENHVAVKRLREKITKGQKEFETEAAVLGKIRHSNVLAMRAYYLGPKGEKLLVLDYMPNGSLASFLHARAPETAISWEIRMNVIVGITKGLCHLHNIENMVHGNLTSSNVLLDDQNNPMIGDVGLSRLMTSAANTNVIATAGTQGYRAPELLKIKNANTKTDVYSLGVIMLELLTGKSPSEGTDGLDLPQWVASVVKEEWTNEVFDLELMRGDVANIGDELLNTLKLALHCVDPDSTARPEVKEVLEKLEEIKPEVADGGGLEAAPAKSE